MKFTFTTQCVIAAVCKSISKINFSGEDYLVHGSLASARARARALNLLSFNLRCFYAIFGANFSKAKRCWY